MRVSSEAPPLHPSDDQTTEEVVVAQCHRLELERSVDVHVGRGSRRQDRLEERPEVLHWLIRLPSGHGELRGCVDHRELELLLVCIEIHEQIEDLVDHGVATLLRPIDLVDHEDGTKPVRERLLKDKPGLRHDPLDGVDEEEHPVHHPEHPLHLAPEVRVPRGVDELDARALPVYGGGLGEDRDPALPLQIPAVEDLVRNDLIRTQRSREA